LKYPAIEVGGVDPELALAIVDDYSPTAADHAGDSQTIYFRDAPDRDAAKRALAAAFPDAVIAAREVDDQDWARRSQENLQPITVGRITVYPFLRDRRALRSSPGPRVPSPVAIVIQPSMGFGTGHHATTRLCLLALQREDLGGSAVLDIGTGSGILAIAAVRLGASRATGIDNDPDAIQAARENLALNPEATGVVFEVADLTDLRLKPDATNLALANLTGALLAREAGRILGAVRRGGRIIVSGLLAEERDQVVAAFKRAALVTEDRDDEWVALTFQSPNDLL
jgi:ribosomal protein L11 methyltransferase